MEQFHGLIYQHTEALLHENVKMCIYPGENKEESEERRQVL